MNSTKVEGASVKEAMNMAKELYGEETMLLNVKKDGRKFILEVRPGHGASAVNKQGASSLDVQGGLMGNQVKEPMEYAKKGEIQAKTDQNQVRSWDLIENKPKDESNEIFTLNLLEKPRPLDEEEKKKDTPQSMMEMEKKFNDLLKKMEDTMVRVSADKSRHDQNQGWESHDWKILERGGFHGQWFDRLGEKANKENPGQLLHEFLMKEIANSLTAIPLNNEFDRGFCAIVGPTGSGKTTTIAKLISKSIEKYGREAVGLITTDFYRVGAYEQIRMYAEMFGVEMIAVKQEEEFLRAIEKMKAKKVVYVDTIGAVRDDDKNQRQMKAFEWVKENGLEWHCALAVQSSLNPKVIESDIRAWKKWGIDQIILTKMDEAVELGGVISAMINHQVSARWMTSGQKVPSDLHRINPAFLVHKSLKMMRDLEKNK